MCVAPSDAAPSRQAVRDAPEKVVKSRDRQSIDKPEEQNDENKRASQEASQRPRLSPVIEEEEEKIQEKDLKGDSRRKERKWPHAGE
jgi:hypothetical protein